MPLKITERPNGRQRVQVVSNQPSRTEQSHREECDINRILRKHFPRTTEGVMANGMKYGNFASGEDYFACVNRVHDAISDFMSLPSDIRKRFGNDVTNLLDYMAETPNAQQEIEKMVNPKGEPAKEDPPAVPEEPPGDAQA
jgi:hypothetical protein